MKHPWIVYVIVALLSVGAGVAIAGLPTDTPDDVTIVAETTTTAVAPAPTTTTAAVFVPTTDDPTDPSTPTEETVSILSTSTTAETTTTTTTVAPPERSAVAVVVVNGAGEAGLAADSAAILQGTGWTNIRATTGLEVVDATTVYYADGFEASAAQLAADLALTAESIAPIALTPPAEDVGLTQLIAYLGTDRVL